MFELLPFLLCSTQFLQLPESPASHVKTATPVKQTRSPSYEHAFKSRNHPVYSSFREKAANCRIIQSIDCITAPLLCKRYTFEQNVHLEAFVDNSLCPIVTLLRAIADNSDKFGKFCLKCRLYNERQNFSQAAKTPALKRYETDILTDINVHIAE